MYDLKKTEHLLALDGANERLHLFKAELLEEGAFDSVVDGCIGVFHTASPCYYNAENPQNFKLSLKMLAIVPSIKRVIITSSLGAVVFTGKPLADNGVIDETWFSDPVICQKSKLVGE
ncbi:hypothetical protein SCA6_002642 [Theobroma cacao]